MLVVRKQFNKTAVLYSSTRTRENNSHYLNLQTLDDKKKSQYCKKSKRNLLNTLKLRHKHQEMNLTGPNFNKEYTDMRTTEVSTPMSAVALCVLPTKSYVKAKPPRQLSLEETHSPLFELAESLFLARLKLFSENLRNKEAKKAECSRSAVAKSRSRRACRRNRMRNGLSVLTHEEPSFSSQIPLLTKNCNWIRGMRLTRPESNKMSARKCKSAQGDHAFRIRIVINKKTTTQ
eukprot:TRINITY_DN15549_c0_g3_i1.p1 TRINITY_DN15549_c0_g3~~TRINITY_DN15549_c0_g3_i1.p1  ORF type:complete len:233 (-),score=8.20 TRINITY_DN15549_c0_g3_i1:160-858(-)